MARLRLAAVALYCCIALSTAAGRTLQQSWDEALKQSLQVVDQAAGQVFGQVADGVAASGVVDHSVPPALQNKTIDGINRYAPVFKTDTGYFIRPQVASALHNAAEGLGPVHVSWLGQTAAPPEAQQRAPAPAPVSSRRLLAVPRAAAPAAAPSAAATPAAAPSYAADGPVAAAEALVLAAWAPKGSAALADSFAKKRAEAPAGEEKGKEKKGKKKHKAAEAPLGVVQGTVQAAQQGAAPATSATSTLEQDLRPKKTDPYGVSLDPNQPNKLPGPLRLATQQQMAASGHQTQASSPTAATEGTPFAGETTGQLPGPLRIASASPLDGPSVSGSEISAIVGVRIATPFFGTGFNFCIDRYFGSFPKVGIVIPNPAQWLLPEFQDIGRTLQTTLQLPPDATIGHGFTLEPTSDGFLISLPSIQPNNIPDGGVRYGIQIGQAFGYDFGLGILRDICFISFVTV